MTLHPRNKANGQESRATFRDWLYVDFYSSLKFELGIPNYNYMKNSVLKTFQPRLKYGVIHIARTPKGEGRGQVNAYDCVQGRGRLILAIFVRTNYVMTSIIASKNRIFRRLMKWKNKIKRTKMLLKINRELVRA